jgi:preprotein translocase subunit SecG
MISCIGSTNDYLTKRLTKGIIRLLYVKKHWINCLEALVEIYLDIALIITSIALIASVILQSKGAGLGGLTGGDTGGIFTARRGIEKTLFRITIGLSVLFFVLAVASVLVK